MIRGTRLLPLALVLTGVAALAGGAPVVIEGGTSPAVIGPGQTFTLFANVSDPDGPDDVMAVGVICQDQLVTLLPETAPGRFEAVFAAPGDLPVGVWPLEVVAVDQAIQGSTALPFLFATRGEAGVQLISPPDGSEFGCQSPGRFAWEPYPGAVAYVFELYLPMGFSAAITVPAMITEIPLPQAAWQFVPDGPYFWRVGTLQAAGDEPGLWSDLWGFTKACEEPGPGEHVAGVVLEVRPEALQLVVGRHLGQGPGCESVVVQAGPETVILGPDGQGLAFGAIVPGDGLLAEGTFEGELFLADRIHVHTGPGPGPGQAAGPITAVDLEAARFTVAAGAPLTGQEGQVMVQVTPDTLILNRWGEAIALADLEIGWFAVAEGEWDGDLLVARHVMVAEDGPGPADEVFGQVIEIRSEIRQLVLQPRTGEPGQPGEPGAPVAIQVVDATVIMTAGGQPMTFEEIALEDRVLALGDWAEEVLVARELYVHRGSPPDHETVYGRIAAVDPEAAVVTIDTQHPEGALVPVQVTAETVIMDELGRPLGLADLQIGWPAMARGHFEGDLFQAAYLVVQGGPGPGEQVGGLIVEVLIESSRLVLQPGWGGATLAVQAGEATVILDAASGQALAFTDLVPGMVVEATGVWQGEIFAAAEIMVLGSEPPPPATVAGPITGKDELARRLLVGHDPSQAVWIQVTPDTLIVNPDGEPLTFETILVGWHLAAAGRWEGSLFVSSEMVVWGESQA